MGRPGKFSVDQVLDSALQLLEEEGVRAVTMARLCRELGAPSGSLYHRFPSRDRLLAELWLRCAERFQGGFIDLLERPGDPREIAREGVLYTITRARTQRGEALMLMNYRREELLDGAWPQVIRKRAQTLRKSHGRALARFGRRLWPKGEADLARLHFALVDIPVAAAMAELRSSGKEQRDSESWVQTTLDALLRHL